MMKRIVSMLLCLLMVVSVVAPSTMAAPSVSTGYGMDDIYFGDGSNVVYNDDGSITVTSSETPRSEDTSSLVEAPKEAALPQELGQASAAVEDTTVDALGVPQDSSLTVAAPKAEMEPVIDQMAADHEGTSSELFRYDISVQDKNGLDWQPNGKVRLEMDAPAGKQLHKNDKVYVVHISDDGKADYIDAQVNDAGKIVFETDGFSTFAGFTVDFEYEDVKFSINGLESILLSEVFTRLEMSLDVEDVKDVTFTDYSLISIEKQGSDWLLTSLQAFQTTESLKVTMTDGAVYDITVTDAIAASDAAKIKIGDTYYDARTSTGEATSNTNGEVTWYLDGQSAYLGNAYYAHRHASNYKDAYGDGWSGSETIEIIGPGTMQINLQHQQTNTKDSSGNYTYYGGSTCALRLDLYQIKITGGAKVVFRLGGSFSGDEESITIQGTGNVPIFDVQDGSLFLRTGNNSTGYTDGGIAVTLPDGASRSYFGSDSSSYIPMYLDGQNLGTSAGKPLIYAHQGKDEVDRQNIVVEDVIFKNAQYRAVRVATNRMTNLSFYNCTFSSSVKSSDGGGAAIYISDESDDTYNEGTTNVVDVNKFNLVKCTFDSNEGVNGPGGAIASYGDIHTLNIDGCTFKNCTSASRGGAIEFSVRGKTLTNHIYNWFRIKDTTFTNCTAYSHGGAIDLSGGDARLYLASNLTITGCTFTNCTATNNRGGAIRMLVEATQNSDGTTTPRNLTISNSGFSGCTSVTGGGAVSIQGTIGNVSISGSKTDSSGNAYTFKDCSTAEHGGAVTIQTDSCSSLTLTGAVFTDLKGGTKNETDPDSAYHGGGVYLTGTVGDVTIQGATSTVDGTTTTTPTSFTNCSASARGGAVAIMCSTVGDVKLSDSSFVGNTAKTLGGAFHVGISATSAKGITVGDVTVERCTFDGNKAYGGVGGGLSLTDGTYDSVLVEDSTFQNCYSANYGGAIGLKTYADAAVEKFPVKVNKTVKILDCYFENCTSGGLSPETWDDDNDSNTPNVEMTWDHDGDPTTEEITKLNGTGGGGAIAIGGEIVGETGADGTYGIVISGTSETERSTFKNCYTWNNGGAICFMGTVKTKKIDLQYLDIDGCRARDAGNAIHLSNAIVDDLKMDTCTIQNCSYFTPGFTGMEIPSDYKTTLGEKVFASYDAGGTFRCIGNTTCRAVFERCQFLNNDSYENGGGVYWNANYIRTGAGGTEIVPSLTLKGNTFDGNHAGRDGGGVYVEATVTVQGCEFMNNVADGRGGAIAQQVYSNAARVLGEGEATNLILDPDTVIWNNHAVHGGGISITVSDTVSLVAVDGKYINYPVKFQLNGATVRDNWASGNGGGIYYATTAYEDEEIQKKIDSFEKEILIDNGLIYGNKTGCDAGGNVLSTAVADTQHGGGIYMFSNQPNTGTDATTGQVYGYSSMTLTGGNIYSNIANNGNGGGIYLTGKGATCEITGGTIGADEVGTALPNEANKTTHDTTQDHGCGGGIAIHGGASITMRRPWKVDENGNYLDADGNVTTEDKRIEDTTLAGGIVINNKAQLQGAGIWLAYGSESAGTINSITINGGTITKNTITAADGNSANGGGIYVGRKGSLTMNGGSIVGCTAVGWGGGVFCDIYATFTMNGGTIGGTTEADANNASAGGGIGFQQEGSATITGGEITGNKADIGGGIYVNCYTKITINGGNVTNNTATTGDGGGIMGNGMTLDITSGSVNGNHAPNGNGGGICAKKHSDTISTVTLSGGNISGNDADQGGGIYVDASTVTLNKTDDAATGNVDGNSAVTNGGGVYATNGSTVTVSGDLKNNSAGTTTTTDGVTTVTAGNGGGAYITGSSTITVEGNVSLNHADYGYGGGIYATGTGVTATVKSNVLSNTALFGGGVAGFDSATVEILGGSVSDNTASADGGGIYADNANVQLKTVDAAGNDAALDDSGALIGKLLNNTATNGNGGGAYLTGGADLTVAGYVGEDGQGNTAGQNGGGVYATGSGSIVSVTGYVQHNTANTGDGGGAYIANGGKITLSTGNIDSNTAQVHGGGVYAEIGSTVEISGGNVQNNTATTGNGGGLHVYDSSEVTISGGNIQDNKALATETGMGYGGGVHAYQNSTVTVTGGDIHSNQATYGGGASADVSSTITVYGNIHDNTATYGGGAAVAGGSTLTVNGGTIEKNTATANGGGIYADAATVDILTYGGSRGLVQSNTAASNGGGIYATNKSAVSLAGDMYLNVATSSNGGGAFISSGSTMEVTGNIGAKDLGNSAQKYGGGIHVTGAGSVVTITGSVLYNTASRGGGMCVGSGANATITGGDISHNTVDYEKDADGNYVQKDGVNQGGSGGGIYCSGAGEVNMTNGSIASNTAILGGGIYITGTKTININSGNVNDNIATTSHGGGIYASGEVTINLGGSLYSNTAAANGGGAYLKSGADMTITGTVGAEGAPNKAANYGGGIHATGAGTTVTVKNSIQYNEAIRGGGAAVWSDASLTVDGGNIQYNTVKKSSTSTTTAGGGGVYVASGTMYLTSGNIQYNYAQTFAGGMYCGGASTVEIRGSITGNTADGNGGGVYCEATSSGAPVLDLYGSVTNNKAKTNGGGMYVSRSASATDTVGAAQVSIIGGSVTDNHANCAYDTDGVLQPVSSANSGNGGGLFVKNGTLILQASSDGTVGQIEQNSAVNGGGIYAIDSTINLAGNIQDNDAVFYDPNNTYSGVVMGMGGGICAFGSTGTTTINLTGSILENTAQMFGGGAYVEGANATMEITGGNVKDNVATRRNGGGLLVSTGASVTFSNGEISGNKALGSGYVFDGVEEKGYGGGVHAYNGGQITITGGSITNNQADFGGGIAAEIDAVVIFTNTVSVVDGGGSLSNNVATEYGGGIYAEASTVTVSGGTITQNKARYGGGIAAVATLSVGASGTTATVADATCSVTVEGGAITTNYALYGGGVYARDDGTEVIVRGGSVTSNQARTDYADPDLTQPADGFGGGIYVSGANVQVNKPNETTAAGMVIDNKAAQGGGVYVTAGGDLTVKGGYIIENYAYGNEGVSGTSMLTGSGLVAMPGIGGGIFVSDGVSATDPSTFTLLGQDETGATAPVAIYGNLAGYSADDVFSNGNDTQLNVPKVGDMDLTKYETPVDSWVEDYAIGDPNYYQGLNGFGMTASSTDYTTKVVRYRGAPMALRVPVSETAATFTPNVTNAYVCMTLGVPGIIADKVVIDYGLQVDIDVLSNDNFSNRDNILDVYVGPVPEDMPEVDQTAPGSAFISMKSTSDAAMLSGSYGKIEVLDDGTLVYRLDGMAMEAHDKFCYVVKYVIGSDKEAADKTFYYYTTVTVIPATTIYYEEDFKAAGESDLLITYTETEKGSLPTNGWTVVGSPLAGVSQDVDQVTLTDADVNTVYGYDSHYTNKYQYSMGGALKTTVYTYKDSVGNITGQKTASAVFRFTGTGFDVISLTSNKTGTVLVNVFRLDANGKRIDEYNSIEEDGTETDTVVNPFKSVIVDTYYGYTYDTEKGEWIVTSSDSESALYQIPVINVYGLEHGLYEVELYVAYNTWFDHDQYSENNDLGGKYDFCLDAIRIYDPVKSPDSVVIETDSEGNSTSINDIYLHHGEAWPLYHELRDQMLPTEREAEIQALLDALGAMDIRIANIEEALKSGKEDTELTTELDELVAARAEKQAELDAILEVEFQNAGAVYIDGKDGQLTVGDCTFYGPNNEIYLNKGSAITTTLVIGTTNIDSIYVGMKVIKGSAGIIEVYEGTTLVKTIQVDSASDMYYDISGIQNLTLKNASENDVVIAITNVKVTHTGVPSYGTSGTAESGPFSTDIDNLGAVLMMLTGDTVSETEPVTDPELTLSYPSLSFEDEIFYNVYFTAGDVSSVVEMGLMILPSYLTDGTMDDAIGTVPGYVTNGSVYMVKSEGIAAAYMGDTMYFKVYAKLSDGSYVYSGIGGYNAKAYANTVLNGDYTDAMKSLVVAMVNYGAEAQLYFGHNTDALVNSGLTDEQKALVNSYDESMVDAVVSADSTKTGNFVRVNSNFSALYPSVSFDGAFSINYYCTPAITVDSGMTLYWWDAETYASIDAFTIENATGSMEMTENEGQYWGNVSGIAAKDMDKTYYVSCVFESEGETVTTGIISYSLGKYCESKAATDGDAQQAFAQATAVYGYYAKQYFAQN